MIPDAERLYDGFFNRGTMKYNGPQKIVLEEGMNIEPKYLAADNKFNNGNLKIPKEGKFSAVGLNGFAIHPEKAQKYKDRIDQYLIDSEKFGV